MDKTYDPQAIESRWYELWESKDYFAPSGNNESYCIMIPPPNVTGTLHMGHAFQDTLMDALIRFHRMRSRRTLWQPGTDHAGIATQMVVERQLQAENQSRHDLGREAFVERVWDWKEESGGTITRQLRRMGASCDWSRERFTMDEGLSKAVVEVFVRLFDEGLIYRGQRLVNWDPKLLTAISDLEVLSEEENSHMWHFRYPVADADGNPTGNYLVVATTRPETMLGDTAVAVHPDDERYKDLIGGRVRLPLCDRLIPIVGDEHADPEKGTGCVKITPAHDFNDYEVGLRHDLPMLNVFTAEAHINDNAPEKYRGLDRYAARKQVVSDLEALGLVEKIEHHRLMVPRGDRSGVVIEPWLTDQWFVKADVLAKPAIAAVESGRIRFIPENWTKTYYEWMHNIQDWCISRQLWWGHRIPAWYDDAGNIYVARDEAEVRAKHKLPESVTLRQDDDVLDTWFSSALWPFSTLGWPDDTAALKDFYPGNVLVTGFDIIFFWVARMIMMGLHFMDDVPFHEVYVHGLVRDADGQKMSKSKGNVLDPLDVIDGIELEPLVKKRTSNLMQPERAEAIEKSTRKQFPDGIAAFGTDALRFTFAAMATTGRDIRFDLSRVEGYRNYCNKIWNAARYVQMQCEQPPQAEPEYRSAADRWILSRLQHTIAEVTRQIEQYRFDLAAACLYEFTWHEFCDWYLELSKPVLFDQSADSAAAAEAARYTLLTVLETILRLHHPIMPFISEEIWQQLRPLAQADGDTIMLQPWPVADEDLNDQQAEDEIRWLQEVVLGLRRIRAEMNLKPGQAVPVLFHQWSEQDRAFYQHSQHTLHKIGKIASAEWISDGESPPESAMALAGELQILIPLAGLIDKDAEIERLSREVAKLEENLNKTRARLANPNFTDKAPADVVQGVRDLESEQLSALEQLNSQIEKLRAA